MASQWPCLIVARHGIALNAVIALIAVQAVLVGETVAVIAAARRSVN